MSLPTATLELFRNEWAARFTDSCVIRRVTARTLSTSTGQTTPTYAQQYSGACLYRPGGQKAAEFGERTITIRTGTVIIPYNQTAPRVGDEVVLTSTTDPSLTNTVHVIRAVEKDTYLTHRSYEVEEVQDG